MSDGMVPGKLVWIPSNPGVACLAIIVQTPAPKSPPCATKFAYPRRFISTTQALAVRSRPQPEVVGLAEKPNPGSDGITRWKASDALAPCAVGLVSGSIIFSCSTTEPGHPCVTMSGNAFSCFERT